MNGAEAVLRTLGALESVLATHGGPPATGRAVAAAEASYAADA